MASFFEAGVMASDCFILNGLSSLLLCVPIVSL
jgi:hypothetical protein